jgi:DNA (cytosine-5)-methyltransferase 1
VLGAADVGAPHKRERLWILAWRRELADPQGDERGARSNSLGEARAGAHPERGDLPTACGDLVADPDGGGCEGGRLPTGGTDQRESGGQPDGCGADWGRPWPPAPGDLDGWAQAETQPAVCGVANGTSEGVDNGERLRMLGNGVVPLAAAVAFRTLANRAGLNL